MRHILEAVLWILKIGAQWHMLPQCHPNYKTVPPQFQAWCSNEVLASELRGVRVIDRLKAFIDTSFARAKGDAPGGGLTKAGKGVNIMTIVDRCGLLLSVGTHSAQRHEVRLVQLSLDLVFVGDLPENLLSDKAYDSDPLDADLKKQGVEMIAPHQKNRTRAKVVPGLRLVAPGLGSFPGY